MEPLLFFLKHPRHAVIVLGWAAIATAAAMAVAMVGLALPDWTRGIDGLLILVAFFGILIVGPLWTIRRARRKPRD